MSVFAFGSHPHNQHDSLQLSRAAATRHAHLEAVTSDHAARRRAMASTDHPRWQVFAAAMRAR